MALRKIKELSQKLFIANWVNLSTQDRVVSLDKDDEKLADLAKLDGCYALKTDLKKQAATKEVVHSRYKDLALVEQAFRESKTVHLEMRPINVRKETRTWGHAFVVMMAYTIIRELAIRWQSLDLTVQEGIDQLSGLCMTEVTIKGKASYNKIPTPRDEVRGLLKAAKVSIPKALPSKGTVVTTKRKLASRRKSS